MAVTRVRSRCTFGATGERARTDHLRGMRPRDLARVSAVKPLPSSVGARGFDSGGHLLCGRP
jgi:hypothetical protein